MGLVRRQLFEIFSILDLSVSVSVQSKEVADEGVSTVGSDVCMGCKKGLAHSTAHHALQFFSFCKGLRIR